MDADVEWLDVPRVTEGEHNDALANALDTAVSSVETSPQEMQRIRDIIADLELYTGQKLAQVYLGDLLGYLDTAYDAGDLRYNASYSVVSTIVSRICSFRPRAQFVPRAGDYKTNRLCRDRTDACDAWSVREHYQDEAARAFKDQLITPGGVLKIWNEAETQKDGTTVTRTHMARFPTWEIKINWEDGKYGNPECIYHVRYMSGRAAARMCNATKEQREKIEAGARRLSATQGFSGVTTRDGRTLVRVVDAYQRGPNGRHVFMAGDFIAYDEVWDHSWHPFEFVFFDTHPGAMFWGSSALSKVRGVQAGIDESVCEIDNAHHLSSKLFVTGPNAPEKMTNEIVQYTEDTPGRPYTFHNPKPIDPDAYRWFEMKKAWMFEILGISQNVAQATKPQGVTAAVAIDAVTDLQSDRLSQLSQAWEQLCPRLSEKWFALQSEADEDEEFSIVQRGRARLVKAHADGLPQNIRAFPTSLFGQSIPARFQKAMDAVKAGWFDQEEILKILGVPDLDSVTELKLAEFEWIENFIDVLLEDGKYETPSVWANPIKVFDYARLRYLRADCDGSYPPENMSKMRKLLDYLQPIAQAARDKAAGKQPTPPLSEAPALPGAALGAIPPQSALPGMPVPPPLPGLAPTPEAAPIQ